MGLERELMRGTGPLAVLKLLQRGEMYGYELAAALAKVGDGILDMGQSTLYPMLYNLEAKGLIESTWRSSETGRDRKYYRLTGKGETQLAEDTKQWRSLAGAMSALGILDQPATPASSPLAFASSMRGALS